jgi:hypothetical protein
MINAENRFLNHEGIFDLISMFLSKNLRIAPIKKYNKREKMIGIKIDLPINKIKPTPISSKIVLE